ncbi:MAG: gliding motility-associated C-terminal domain-containing protein, partial [Bacteroidales bacterium]|nr:gliding motility-associated C-terminal domain-containing protein [Bacteroidales bacterium]
STATPTHTYRTVHDCDSVVTLHLTINNSKTNDTTAVECDHFTWFGTDYDASTETPTHTYRTVHDCDSVVTLHLTINNSKTNDTTAVECDHFTWFGTDYTSSTETSTHTYRTTHDCDSVVTLHLTINNSKTNDTTAVECDHFTWFGTDYTSSTATPTHTYRTDKDCDSVVTLHLTINNSVEGTDQHIACDSFTWIDGVTYTASNTTATKTLTNLLGCDSVVTLNLTVNYSTTAVESINACGSTAEWNGNTYDASSVGAVYSVETVNDDGCPLTTTLTVYNRNGYGSGTYFDTVCSGTDSYTWDVAQWEEAGNGHVTDLAATDDGSTWSYRVEINEYNCSTYLEYAIYKRPAGTGYTYNACESYEWRNTTYTESGDYTDAFQSHSCDLTDTLHLGISHYASSAYTVTAVNSFSWLADGAHGKGTGTTYTESGTYLGPLYMNGECQSRDTLYLTIRKVNCSGLNYTASECETFTWAEAGGHGHGNGTTYTDGGTLIGPTYKVDEGCSYATNDTLHLTIRRTSAYTDVHTVCDTYTWIDGNTYTASNTTATDTLVNAANCDSVVTLNLTVNYSATADTTAEECDAFTWFGTTYNASTSTPTHTYRTILDCDSIVTLNLTINNSHPADTTAEECDEFTWHGTTYNASTITPTYTYRTTHDCDSVVTLHLTINYSKTNDTTAVECDRFTWFGTEYDAGTATPTHTYRTVHDCDSVVTLHLTINYSKTNDTTAVECDRFTWFGTTYTASTATPTHTYRTAHDCDSVVTLHLTINNSKTNDTTAEECDHFTWFGIDYTAITDTPTHTYRTVHDCDSVVTLHLTIHNSVDAIDQHIACDSFLWIDGTTYTTSNTTATKTLANVYGCDSVVTLNLTVNYSSTADETVNTCNSTTEWGGNTYDASTTGAVYTVESVNTDGCPLTTTLTVYNRNGYGSGTYFDTVCGGTDSYTWTVAQWEDAGNGHVTDLAATDNGSTWSYRVEINEYNCSTYLEYAIYKRPAGTGYNHNACESYEWRNTTYTESGDYTDTYTATFNSQSCSITDTLHLGISHYGNAAYTSTAVNSFSWPTDGDLGKGTGIDYTESGTYLGPMYMNGECQSRDTLRLTIRKVNCSGLNYTVSECDTFSWATSGDHGHGNGTTYTEGGTYIGPTYKVDEGCPYATNDTLRLTIRNNSNTGYTHEACDSYTWHDVEYTASDDAILYSYTALNGCPSVDTLHLTVKYNSNTAYTDTACDTFLWTRNGQTYTASDDAILYNYDVLNGCPSVDTLHLTINRNSSTGYTEEACDIYTWHDVEYTASDDAILYAYSDANGCASVDTLHLTVWRNSSTRYEVSACDMYRWSAGGDKGHGDDNDYASSTTILGPEYLDQHNCSSTDTLDLTIIRNAGHAIPMVACDSIVWHEQTYRASSNEIYYSYSDNNTCNATDTLLLTINHRVDEELSIGVPARLLPYDWRDTTFQPATADTTIIFRRSTTAECDSIVTLHLTIYPNKYTDLYDTVCDLYSWGEQIFEQSGDYDSVFRGTNDVDSIVTLHLVVNHSIVIDSAIDGCDSVMWRGNMHYSDELYTDNYQTVNGCDSIHNYIVNVHHKIDIDTIIYACDSFRWHSIVTTESTRFTDQGLTVNGCDSTYTVRVKMAYSNHNGAERKAVCDSCRWKQMLLTMSGQYPFDTLTTNNCDSTVTLSLTVYHGDSTIEDKKACDEFRWINGVLYTNSIDTATFIFENKRGCDSVVTLNLEIQRSYHSGDTMTICHHALPYVWSDVVFYDGGERIDTLMACNGCDSIVDKLLYVYADSIVGGELIRACDDYDWRGHRYSATGVYRDTVCGAVHDVCDSIYILNLDVRYSHNDTLDTFYCENKVFNYHGNTYDEPQDFEVMLWTVDGCDSLLLVHLEKKPTYDTVDYSLKCSRDPFVWIDGVSYRYATEVPVYTATSIYGCDSTVHLHLAVTMSPTAVIHAEPFIVTRDNLKVDLYDRSENIVSRRWILPDGERPDTEHATFDYPADDDSTIVWLRVVNEEGCADTARGVILFDAVEVNVPNLFTPNRIDNNKFYVGHYYIDQMEVSLFTRQGQLVYTFKDKDDTWDGTYNGVLCPQGAYVYVIRYTSIRHPKSWLIKKGTVVLVR